MWRKFISFFLIGFLVFSCTPAVYADSLDKQARTLTIDQAITLALSNSEALKKATLNIERGEEVREQAAEKVRFIPLEPTTPEADMAFIGSIAADVGLQMTKKAKGVEEDKIRLNVFKAYLKVLEASEDRESSLQQFKQAQLQWTIASLSYELGMANSSEKTMAEALFKTKKAALEISETGVTNAYRSFTSIVGLDLNEQPKLISEITYAPMELDNLDTKVHQIVSQNPITDLMKNKADLANLQLNLYNWADPMREPYKAKEIDVQNAKLDITSSKQQMRDALYNLHNSIRQLEESYIIQEQQRTIAEEKYNQQKLKYDVGMTSKIDLLTAEVDYENAQAQLNKTVYQHEILKQMFEKPWAAEASGSMQQYGDGKEP